MEKSVKLKAASTMMGAAMIMGGAMAALPAEAVAQGMPDGPDAAAAAFAQDAAELGLEGVVAAPSTNVREVQGTFSFDQATVTSNEAIANVFQRAAATLCQTLPDYGVSVVEQGMDAIKVAGPDGSFVATVDELSDGEDFGTIMGCACATNAPGGGAIANAEVQGVALTAIAALAQAI